ncbi:MAG: MFS transporter [Propionibacteriaceae bacterium]
MTDSPVTGRSTDIVIDRKSLIKAYVASLTGTSLEWYDFAVYSAASALVLPRLFFPGSDPLTGTLLAFSTYAVGYFSRPLGGIFFGRLGDKIGRKNVLVITLLLIGIATVAIGLLPTYGTIGIAAPIILVLLRFAQGVGVGGEWGGAVLLSSEFGEPRKRGLWSSAAQLGPPAGNLLANGMLALLTSTMSDETFLSWGWRLAFLVSAVLVAFGLWIRLRLEDTPVFKAIQASGDRPDAPISEVFRTELRGLLSAILCRLAPDILYALFTVFALVYGTTVLGFSSAQVLTATLIGSACQLALIPFAGWLSDRVNRRLLYAVVTVLCGIWPFIFFPMVQGRNWGIFILGVVIGLAIHSFLYGPQAAFITEQFSPRLRYTGSSLGYTIAGVFGGALAPLLFTLLLQKTGGWIGPALYLCLAVLLTLVGVAIGRNPQHEEDEEYLAIGAASREAQNAG